MAQVRFGYSSGPSDWAKIEWVLDEETQMVFYRDIRCPGIGSGVIPYAALKALHALNDPPQWP